MFRLFPKTRRKFWVLVGVLLISLPVLWVVVNCYFNFDSPDYQQWAYRLSPRRLYRNYRWRQFDKADRVNQHKMLLARVQAAGGWTALQRDCDALVQTNRDFPLTWDNWTDRTNALPPAIAALQPMEVMYWPPSVLRGNHINTEFSIVRINIISGHPNTGGRATPWFGLEVVCGTNADGYSPHPIDGVDDKQAYGGRYHNYEKMTNGIYEFY